MNCSFCSLSVFPKNLKNHQKVCLQNPEKEEPSIKCALCEKSFSSNSNLKRHKTIQHDKDSEFAPSIVKPQSCYPSTSSANATTQNLTYLLVDEYKSVEQILSKDGARVHIKIISLVRPNSNCMIHWEERLWVFNLIKFLRHLSLVHLDLLNMSFFI